MKQQIAFAVLAALTLAAPAVAEPMRPVQSAAPGVLPPYEIMTIIRSTGFDPLDRAVRRGSHYVVHAIGNDGREVRVLVDARSGRIVSLTPVETASRLPPRTILEEDEPMPMPGYLPPGRPGPYEMAPPAVYRGERRVIYEEEPPAIYPPAEVPMAPPPSRGTTLPSRSAPPPARADAPAVSEPQVITAIEPGRAGLLPPPPERFPNRAPATAAKAKPVKRAVAALPKQPPLPKPRPGIGVAPSTPNATNKPLAEQLPN